MDDSKNIEIIEPFAALEKVEFNQEGHFQEFGALVQDQLGSGLGRTARGQQIIHQNDTVPRIEGILVHLDTVGAVFQLVCD